MAAFKSKLTRAIATQICEHLRQGQYKKDAAALVGIHRDTLDYWERRGRAAREHAEHPPLRPDFTSEEAFLEARTEWRRLPRAEKIYADFSIQAELAYDFGAGWLVQQILDHAANPDVRNNKWTAYMTILERSRRDHWGRGQRVEHSTPDGKPFPVSHAFDPSKLTDEELEVLQRLLERARPEVDA
jgi:hypothetical protein